MSNIFFSAAVKVLGIFVIIIRHYNCAVERLSHVLHFSIFIYSFLLQLEFGFHVFTWLSVCPDSSYIIYVSHLLLGQTSFRAI